MTRLAASFENYIWNNFKFYLMTHKTCLCDNVLKIVNPNSDDPVTRYNDFMNQITEHFGLGSFTIGQAAQFSRIPYITMNVGIISDNNCSLRAQLEFDVMYSVDTPDSLTGERNYAGNNNESIAAFKSNICNALDEIMFNAYNDDTKHYERSSFFNSLRDTSWVNPITKTGDPKPWKYNIVGTVDDTTSIGDTYQLEKEDKSTGNIVFTVIYDVDIYHLYGDGEDCGC